MWKTYHSPTTLDEALTLLGKHAPHARLVAGATDLILEIERGLRPGLEVLIDTTRIAGLDRVSLDSDGWIHLGPGVTHNQCLASTLIRKRAYPLARACWEIGSPQIRNRGTVAGNLVTASPANDTIPPLIALGARLTLRSPRGERTLALDAFYAGVRRTVMAPDEFLTDIAFPALGPGDRGTFVKIALRRAQAISVVNAAVLLSLEADVVRRAAVSLGAVAPVILRAPEAEAALIGQPLEAGVMARAAELAAMASRPIDDLRGSAEFRREMIRVSVLRSLRAVQAGTERKGFPARPVMLGGLRLTTGLDRSAVHTGSEPIETTLNGHPAVFATGHDKTLLRLLREEAGLIGTKEGCAEGECGACTVFLDGAAVMACMVPAPRAHRAEVVTIEGLAREGRLHPIQQAFIDEGAVQCGYCTPGFLMSGAKLLEERRSPAREEIRQAFTGNLCRCTGYYKIVTAVERAAAMEHERKPEPV
jgi:xanthine dehydrogenase iron-sulfur cluster and FAD-binding subunit A